MTLKIKTTRDIMEIEKELKMVIEQKSNLEFNLRNILQFLFNKYPNVWKDLYENTKFKK